MGEMQIWYDWYLADLLFDPYVTSPLTHCHIGVNCQLKAITWTKHRHGHLLDLGLTTPCIFLECIGCFYLVVWRNRRQLIKLRFARPNNDIILLMSLVGAYRSRLRYRWQKSASKGQLAFHTAERQQKCPLCYCCCQICATELVCMRDRNCASKWWSPHISGAQD